MSTIEITGTRPVMTTEGVIPGRSAAEGKGIHGSELRPLSPPPCGEESLSRLVEIRASYAACFAAARP